MAIGIYMLTLLKKLKLFMQFIRRNSLFSKMLNALEQQECQLYTDWMHNMNLMLLLQNYFQAIVIFATEQADLMICQIYTRR